MKANDPKILSVVAGTIVGFSVLLMFEGIGSVIFIHPKDLDFPASEVLSEYLMANMPTGAFTLALFARILSSFAGGFTATKISREQSVRLPMAVGILLTIAGVPNFALLTHPAWRISGLMFLVPFALLGHKVAESRRVGHIIRRIFMSISHIPNGFTSLTPYFIVDDGDKFLRFLNDAFECEVVDDHREDGKIRHAAIKIYGSMIEASEGNEQFPPRKFAMHLYVPDCDAVYANAIAAGGESIFEVADMPYGERSGGVTDPFGNQWYIATQQIDMYPNA